MGCGVDLVALLRTVDDPAAVALRRGCRRTTPLDGCGRDLHSRLLWADIVLNFFTGFVDLDNHMLIMSRPLIIKNYVRGWFLFDIIATLPWDEMSNQDAMLSPMRAAKATKMSKALRAVKILKLLRVIKVVRTARNVQFLYDQKPIDVLEAETREERTNIGKTWVYGQRLAAQASVRDNYAWLYRQLGDCITPCKILATLAFSSHFFACAIAAVLPEVFMSPTVNEALYSYYRRPCHCHQHPASGLFRWPHTSRASSCSHGAPIE